MMKSGLAACIEAAYGPKQRAMHALVPLSQGMVSPQMLQAKMNGSDIS